MSGDLTELVEQLAARVERLEQAQQARRPEQDRQSDRTPRPQPPLVADTTLVQRLAAALDPGDGDTPVEPVVTYAGLGQWNQGTIGWQMAREWDEILAGSGDNSASLFSALASPIRVRIVAELLRGQVSTAQLGERLDQPSAGQLFHHIKELLAAGLVYQPVRGTYAVHKHHVIPLLTLLSATLDISPPAIGQEDDAQ